MTANARTDTRPVAPPSLPRVWIDIDNPPQVQYLLPLHRALRTAGMDTVVTARNYGTTVEMLQAAGVTPQVFGARVGQGRLRKGVAVLRRAQALARFFPPHRRPDVVVAASRAAAVAAWRMRVPAFLIGDYEHVHVRIYRLTRSKILYPDVIDPAVFMRQGLREQDLVPFHGLKEDLTFAGCDLDAIEPYDLGDVPAGAVRVLFRPPSETSHYYNAGSSTMARAALRWLAAAGAVVVFAPREPEQAALLEDQAWAHPPIILRRAVPFAALLTSVDAVVCGGGTMLREAAYLGIPAYSIFRSRAGAVDSWLEDVGRVRLVQTPADLAEIELRKRGPLRRLDSNPHLVDELVAMIATAVAERKDPVRCLIAA